MDLHDLHDLHDRTNARPARLAGQLIRGTSGTAYTSQPALLPD